MEKLSFAVVIPTYQREDVLCQTIREILKQSIKPDEFVIIDQSEEHLPETERFLREHYEKGHLRWITKGPPSLSLARNRALAETKSEVLIFIDDDISTHRNFLREHIKNYYDHETAAVCGRVFQSIFREETALPNNINFNDPGDVGFKIPHNYAKRICAPKIFGGNFSVRRKVMKEIKGFNEYLPTLGEDGDIAFRLWEKRMKVIFDPRAWILHLRTPKGGCRLTEDNNITNTEWKKIAGYAYLAFRYGGIIRPKYFVKLLWLTMRSSFLLKRNIKSPKMFIKSMGNFVLATHHAFRWAQLREPLVTVKW